jgi:transcriptional regulator
MTNYQCGSLVIGHQFHTPLALAGFAPLFYRPIVLPRDGTVMASDTGDLLQGTLELLILNTLARESMHGYGIVQRIHEAAEDLLKVEDGSLYPALYRMEERGLIKSEWGLSDNNRRARFYKLTRAGQRKLEAERANWNRISKAVTRILQAT